VQDCRTRVRVGGFNNSRDTATIIQGRSQSCGGGKKLGMEQVVSRDLDLVWNKVRESGRSALII
jgi:hypothetical protein